MLDDQSSVTGIGGLLPGQIHIGKDLSIENLEKSMSEARLDMSASGKGQLRVEVGQVQATLKIDESE